MLSLLISSTCIPLLIHAGINTEVGELLLLVSYLSSLRYIFKCGIFQTDVLLRKNMVVGPHDSVFYVDLQGICYILKSRQCL
jgi:isocitrate dehydrogenase kinase/phosphatase